MNLYDQYEYEGEINFRDLFETLRKRWKNILICAVIFGSLFGGYKGLQGYRVLQDEEALAESQVQYEKALSAYDFAKEQYRKRIVDLQNEIRQQEEYRDQSVLMQIDPNNVWTAAASYYVDVDYKIMPGMDYQNVDHTSHIMNAYRQMFFQDGVIGGDLEKGMGQDKEFNKLISIIPDPENGLLMVTIKGPSKEFSGDIMEKVDKSFKENSDKVREIVGAHKITLLKKYESSTIDSEIQKMQLEFRDNLTRLEKGITDAMTDMDKLKEPANTVYSEKKLVKDMIKFLAAGLIAGAFLCCAFYGTVYLFDGTLKTSDYLTGKYNALILGEMRRGGKNEASESAFIAANIRNLLGETRNLLITGNPEQACLKQFADKVSPYLEGISVICEGEMMKNPEAVKALGAAPAIVLVEETGKTKETDVDAAIRMCEASHSNVLGYALIR